MRPHARAVARGAKDRRMSDLAKISMQLDILIELLATMHPLKPCITFHSAGRGYDIAFCKPDPQWPLAGDAKPIEEVEVRGFGGVSYLVRTKD